MRDKNDVCKWEVSNFNNPAEQYISFVSMSCKPKALKGNWDIFPFNERYKDGFLNYCSHCGKKIKFI